MNNKSRIIIGADQGNLYFERSGVVAHAILPTGISVYCVEHPDPAVKRLCYVSRENGLIVLPEGAIMRARFWPIDFNSMSNREIDARFFAYNMNRTLKNETQRVVHFDNETHGVTLEFRTRGEALQVKKSSWKTEGTFTHDYVLIDKLCNQFRISLTANDDLGQYVVWTARSPHMNGIMMESETRNRAVLQLLLLEAYSRNPLEYLSREQIDNALSHCNRLEV
ncbi:hypothetical protein HYQ37_gp068 [Salmonella phage pertopsoe]|uniref:Uncharacterized protein n=1 Tax=Salmonella phage pertopsoe TaxID=2713310 RepID=A0A6G8RPG1_9CAUD|nr:hypothetical protein HYQ37_gp068 [Salmonella phage pertopsoe]QIO03273.1 hypothetical protein pertopsoe_68 [Salmonella phage pertopsoe]